VEYGRDSDDGGDRIEPLVGRDVDGDGGPRPVLRRVPRAGAPLFPVGDRRRGPRRTRRRRRQYDGRKVARDHLPRAGGHLAGVVSVDDAHRRVDGGSDDPFTRAFLLC